MAEILIDFELKPYKLLDLYMTSKGIPSSWTARNLDVSVSLISEIRSGKANLTENMRQKINELLETNY